MSLSIITVALATGPMRVSDSNSTVAFHGHLIFLSFELILFYFIFILYCKITGMQRGKHGGFLLMDRYVMKLIYSSYLVLRFLEQVLQDIKGQGEGIDSGHFCCCCEFQYRINAILSGF